MPSGNPRAALVRETLGAYFSCGDNAVRAAELLGIHRNTVRKRVDRFWANRESSDGLQIALALRV